MPKSHKHKNFWSKLRFRYRLSILNENTLTESFHIRISRLTVFLLVGIFAIASFFILSLLIFLTPIKHYLPGYSDATIRADLVEHVLLVDSLTQELSQQEYQLTAIKEIVAGTIKVDSIVETDSLNMVSWRSIDLDKTEREQQYCADYEQSERYNLNSIKSPRRTATLVFIKPVRGVLSRPFLPESNHFGVDLTTTSDDVILAAQEGTICYAGFSLENAYVIAIQHDKGFVTFYKNCERLLKRTGDHVAAGEVIAIVGNSNKIELSKPYLHFEIWQKGTPKNPAEYLIF